MRRIETKSRKANVQLILFLFKIIELIFSKCYSHEKKQDAELNESKKRFCFECDELKVIVAKGMCK
jgi:hypothetical protein